MADNTPGGGLIDDNQVHTGRFPLDPYLTSTVRIRLFFNSVDTQDNQHPGWFVQRVRILRYTCDACRLIPFSMAVEDTSGDGNGVWEPGETVQLQSTWMNPTIASFPSFSGILTTTDAGVTVSDSSASFTAVGPGASVGCQDTMDCYEAVSGNTRPDVHWDVGLHETLSSGESTNWLIHIGDSFTDVGRIHLFYPFIETLFHHGITNGCAIGLY